ncbi:hypothetical protein SK128_014292, partial [Halocaridina rubra]
MWNVRKHLCISDALSRAQASHPTPENDLSFADAVTHFNSIITPNNLSSQEDFSFHDADRTLQDLQIAAGMDPSYISLLEAVTSGFPSNR